MSYLRRWRRRGCFVSYGFEHSRVYRSYCVGFPVCWIFRIIDWAARTQERFDEISKRYKAYACGSGSQVRLLFIMAATGGLMATTQLGPIARDFKVANINVCGLGRYDFGSTQHRAHVSFLSIYLVVKPLAVHQRLG